MARLHSASKDAPFQKSFHRNLPMQAISPGPEVGTDQLGTLLCSIAAIFPCLLFARCSVRRSLVPFLSPPRNVGLLNGDD